MRKKISIEFITITALGILATLFFSMWVSYDMIKDQVMEEIRSYAYLLSSLGETISWNQFDDLKNELRVTVVDLDGNGTPSYLGNSNIISITPSLSISRISTLFIVK